MSKKEAVYVLVGLLAISVVWFLVIERDNDEDCDCDG